MEELKGLSERERIATALVELCFELGFRKTSVQMLLERAEVDQAAFDRHFEDMEDCFCGVYKQLRDELMGMLATVVEAEPTWRDRIRATAYAMVGYMEEDAKRTHFTVIEVRTAGERAAVLMGEAFEEMFDLLDAGRSERGDPEGLTRATAEAVGGTIFFQMNTAFEQGSMADVRAKIPEMMSVAVRPYLGEEAAAEELGKPAPARAGSADG